MTALEKSWLKEKREELERCYEVYGPDVACWDIVGFLNIIDRQAREIRRLKTEVAAK